MLSSSALSVIRSLNLAQILMDELHGHRSLTDSGGYPFYRTVAHVANRENSGNICLQQKRVAVESPSFGMLPIPEEVGTSQQETAFVPFDERSEPLSARQCTNKDEHRTGRHALDFVRVRTQDRNLFQVGFAVDFADAGVSPDLNVGHLLDLVDQILRHGAGERVSPHQDYDAVGEFGEIHGRLARGVGATHDVNNLTFTGQGLGGAAAVVNA